ncbi:hypothetical protein J6590_005816 [Homalodisca vitripennis]|nr:hypothetical protein J6590_005816 [Homalodisca vitripennis]
MANGSTLNQISLKLIEIAQCPVCLEFVGTSVVQCARGHGVCAKCKEKLTECPVCKAKYTVEASVMLAKLMEELPKMCENQKQGCQALCIHEHEQFCEFRSTKCRVSDECKWEGSLKQLVSHLETCHHLAADY